MLTFTDKVNIQKEVVLGILPPQNEPQDAKEFREKIQADVNQAKQQGLIVEVPKDWD